MASVFDVAKYILDKYGSMSAMKLQKLIFYSQAMSLVWDDIPLFEEDFQAWAKGPVCPELFAAHKGMFVLKDSNFLKPYRADASKLTAEQIETIDVVVTSLIDLPAYKLSEMTHNEDPWRNARRDLHAGEHSKNIIDKEVMQDYYADNWA